MARKKKIEPPPDALPILTYVNNEWGTPADLTKPLNAYLPWRKWYGPAGRAVILTHKDKVYVIYSEPRICKVYPDLDTAKVAVELQG